MGEHYIELANHYRRLLAVLIFASGSIAATLSAALLLSSPVYTAAAAISVLPGRNELERLPGGQLQSSLIRVHIERLLSREIAKDVLGLLQRNAPAEPPADEPEPEGLLDKVGDVVRSVRGELRRLYSVLNVGEYRQPDPDEAAIDGLSESIEARTSEISNIVQIVAHAEDSTSAARVANAFAEAYQAKLAEEAIRRAERGEARLRDEISTREEELDAVQEKRARLGAERGGWSPDEQRQALLAIRQGERERLFQVRVEKKQLEAQLATFMNNEEALRQRGVLNGLQEEVALLDARIRGLEQSEQMRVDIIGSIDADLAALAEGRGPFDILERDKSRLEAELADLRERLISLELGAPGDASEVQIVAPAKAPDYPSSPKVVRNTVLGLITGVLLAGLLLIVMDTFSGRVRSTVDLRRVVGNRVLGRLPQRLLTRVVRAVPQADDRIYRAIAARRAVIEPQLAASGGLECPVVHVTGFASPSIVDGTALAMAALLATRDFSALCLQHQAGNGYLFVEKAGRLRLHEIPKDPDPSRNSCVVSLGPLAARFKWPAISQPPPFLVCVVPAGDLNEDTVRRFQAGALDRGYSNVHYLLATR